MFFIVTSRLKKQFDILKSEQDTLFKFALITLFVHVPHINMVRNTRLGIIRVKWHFEQCPDSLVTFSLRCVTNYDVYNGKC